MNILLISPLPPPSGGIATWTIRYKKFCEENHINTRVVNIAMLGKRASHEVMRRSLFQEIKRTLGIVKTLSKEIKKDRPDVIHFNTSCQPFGIMRDAVTSLFIPKDIPMVLHCHCNIKDQIGNMKLSHLALKLLIQKANKVIVLNKYSKLFVDGIVSNKATIVPNFADDNMIDENHVVHDEIKQIVYIGHVEKEKGIEEITKAASHFLNIHFNIIGAIREDLSDIVFPSNVELIGRVTPDEVKRYLQKADVFLFPSKSEGFSLALLEAMGMGVPSIVTDVGANSEMTENKGGIVIKNGSAEEIVASINDLASREIRNEMSKWNINKVKNAYMAEKIIGTYLDIYKEAMKGNSTYNE